MATTKQMKVFEKITGGLLYDTGYPIYIEELIKKAKKSIYVTMFYISFDSKKKNSIVNRLVAALVKAKERGVDVNVILDKDQEGDVYNSRRINKEAFDYLKQNGVSVFFDSIIKATHSKVVVIDDNHVFIGSHNWTLNAFYNYNETSLYLNSTELSNYYIRKFKSRLKG